MQLIPMLIGIPLIGFWGWMFGEMSRNPYLTSREKSTWTLWFFIFNVVTAFWYYLVEYRPSRM
ncbi:MAG TPA: hypothetical protein VF813_10620 [Anaerolineaceae bacterium]